MSSDADFVESVFRQLENLDRACMAFLTADAAAPRDLQLVEQAFREVNSCKAELLNNNLLRLDRLAVEVLRTLPGEWGARFQEELIGDRVADVDGLHRRVRHRHSSLLSLAQLLRGSDGPALSDKEAQIDTSEKVDPPDAVHPNGEAALAVRTVPPAVKTPAFKPTEATRLLAGALTDKPQKATTIATRAKVSESTARKHLPYLLRSGQAKHERGRGYSRP